MNEHHGSGEDVVNPAIGAAAAAAAIANAIKASGVLIQVDAEDFLQIVYQQEAPLVVVAPPAFFSPKHKYLTSYKGLAFHAKSAVPLELPEDAELVTARSIHIPS
jgi:hypothetical protein